MQNRKYAINYNNSYYWPMYIQYDWVSNENAL